MKAKIFLMAGIAVISVCASRATAATLYAVDYPASATLYTLDQKVSRLWRVQITTDSLVSIDPTTGLGTLGPAISHRFTRMGSVH